MDLYLQLDKVEHDLTDVNFTLSFHKARERTPDNRDQFTDLEVTLLYDCWEYKDGSAKEKLSPETEKIFGCLVEALASGDQKAKHFTGHAVASLDEWREVCIKHGLIDPAKPDSARTLFNRHKLALITKNWIVCSENSVWIP
jgi:hypothetical protein